VSRSLSLVLPVCNVEETLADKVQHLFEMLNDLTDEFEVLLIDQGSSDHTIDVAQDLAVQYPQVRVSRRAALNPEADPIAQTLAETTGDIVFVQNGHTAVRPSALRQLWEQNERTPTAEAKVSSKKRLPGLPTKAARHSRSDEAGDGAGGLTMICRADNPSRSV
jgi:glycosyltransferase involved in cell wall biosynthesis